MSADSLVGGGSELIISVSSQKTHPLVQHFGNLGFDVLHHLLKHGCAGPEETTWQDMAMDEGQTERDLNTLFCVS